MMVILVISKWYFISFSNCVDFIFKKLMGVPSKKRVSFSHWKKECCHHKLRFAEENCLEGPGGPPCEEEKKSTWYWYIFPKQVTSRCASINPWTSDVDRENPIHHIPHTWAPNMVARTRSWAIRWFVARLQAGIGKSRSVVNDSLFTISKALRGDKEKQDHDEEI